MLGKVIKRNGDIVKFDLVKIVKAINKCIKAVTGNPDDDVATSLAEQVQKIIEEQSTDTKDLPKVEEIQDVVEKVLMRSGMEDVAKSYILYREQRSKLRTSKNLMVDVTKVTDDYLTQDDWRVNENANSGYSYGGLLMHMSGSILANYVLENIYSKDIAMAHRRGDLHIHDLQTGIVGYCAGWDLRMLLSSGFGGVKGKINSSPPKHFSTALMQMVNFLGTLQGEWSGAMAFSSFDTLLAPYIGYEELTFRQVKQLIQQFVFNLNIASRWGQQTPFTNITLDWVVPEHMKDEYVVLGGELQDVTYGGFQREMDMINKAFLEVMGEGDSDGRIFTFPIPTYNITKDFNWDSENADLLFAVTAKYGIPYFQNFVNSDLDPSDVRSMCPLTGDTKVLVKEQIKNGEGYNAYKFRNVLRCIADVYRNGNNLLGVYDGEGWQHAKVIEMDATDVDDVTLENGISIKMGENHLQPVKDIGTVTAKELLVGMEIPTNTKNVLFDKDTIAFKLPLYYAEILGTFMTDMENPTLVYTFKKTDTMFIDTNNVEGISVNVLRYDFVVDFSTRQILVDFLVSLGLLGKDENNNISLTDIIFNTTIDFRRRFVSALFKRFKVLDVILPDKKSSEWLCAVLSTLLSELNGYDISYNDNGNIIVSIQQNNVNRDKNINRDDYRYIKIAKISKIDKNEGERLYCFEVRNESHLFMLGNGVITHNCRLQMDLRELRRRGGGLFGSNDQTGSLGVVTINLPRIGYLSQSKEEFYERLERLMDLVKESLEIKRKVVQKNIDNDLLPYTKRYLGTLKSHFNTIGIIGMHEALLNLMEVPIYAPEGHAFAVEVLKFMRDKMIAYQTETGNLYNLEAVPGEGTSHRLARLDKQFYPEIITAGTEVPYYTNSTQLPVGYTDDLFLELDLQDELQTLYTGGTVLHVLLGESLPDSTACKRLVKKITDLYKLPYVSITPTFSICPVHGYIVGEHYDCPL